MKSNIIFLGISVLEFFILYYMSIYRIKWLHGFVVLNMLMIPVLGGKFVTVFGMTSNIGNLFYAFTCAAQVVLCVVRESKAILNISRSLFAVIFFLIFSQLVVALPVLSFNENFASALARVFTPAPVVIVASFLAFVVSQTFLVRACEKANAEHFVTYGILSILCQLIDTTIFFLIASPIFGKDVIFFAVSGFVIKISLMLIVFPIIKRVSVLIKNGHYQ